MMLLVFTSSLAASIAGESVQVPIDALCPAGVPMPSVQPAPQPPRAKRNVTLVARINTSSTGPSAASPFRGVGVNMDFWPPSKEKWGVSKVGGCGALDADLMQADLAYLAAQLSGSLLRLGGSPVDFLLYETPDTPLACTDAEINKTRKHGGGYFCPNWDKVDYTTSGGAHCLRAKRWKEINAFALRAGLRIAFGMNACWLRPSSSGELDWTYVDAMLKQTAALAARNGSAVWAWEFGNELYRSGVKGTRYGADVKELMKRSAAAWADAESSAGLLVGSLPRPRFVGPDDGLGLSSSYVTEVLNAAEGAVHAITFHDYGNDCSKEMPAETGLAINVSCVDERTALAVSKYGATTEASGAELWYGEGAFHSTSGVRGLTDTFRSSLWYAQKLGSLFSSGIRMLARQTLVGGDYELVNRTTAAPTPDYYTLLLWHRLVGSTPVQIDAASAPIEAPGLRLKAFHAAPGLSGTVTIAVNAHLDLAVELNLGNAIANVYQLSGQPSSNRVFFNAEYGGAELVYRPGGGGLPAMQGHQEEDIIALPPCSITFIHVCNEDSAGTTIV